MAPSSSTASTPSPSPFPQSPAALVNAAPTVAVRSHYYDNSPAFSEDTSYNNSLASDSPKYQSLTLGRSSVFGNRVLSAISEKHPGVVATACSLSRKASQSVRGKSLSGFVTSFQSTDEGQEGSNKSPRRNLGDIFTPRRSSIAPSEDDEESEYIMPYKSSFTGGAGRQSELQAPAKPASTRGFSWFGSIKQAPSPPPPTVADSNIGADLIMASPASLLFPTGSLNDKSPASFDELLANAESLIARLQSVHKAQTTTLHAARAEREAQAEEAQEAETRARHLKLQLDVLAAKSAEQDALNRALAEELAAEKQRRHEDREHFERQARQNELTPRRSRHSGLSIASDSGFESEADTASSCSRPHTPTSPHAPSYNLHNERWGAAMEPIKEVRPVSRDSQTARIPARTCEVDAGVWTFMREEKTRLERRVNELEGVLDGCLDLIA